MLLEHVELALEGVVVESVCLESSLEIYQTNPGGARPRHTPGAWTVLCLQAMGGGSSSALTDRTILPLMHLAPEIGEAGAWTRGRTSAFASSSCCPAHGSAL